MSEANPKNSANTPKAAPARSNPRAQAPTAKADSKPRPKPAMRSDERLIGRSIVGSGGNPHKH